MSHNDEETTQKTNDNRAKLMMAAKNIIGRNNLANGLNISVRNVDYLSDGTRLVKDGILMDTRKLLIKLRQDTGLLISCIREEEAGHED